MPRDRSHSRSPPRRRRERSRESRHGHEPKSDRRPRSRSRDAGNVEGDSRRRDHARSRSRSPRRDRHRRHSPSRSRSRSQERHHKRHYHHRSRSASRERKRRRRDRSVSSASNRSSSSETSREYRKKKREKKRSNSEEYERKERKARKKEKKERKKAKKGHSSTNHWGKYGIISEIDIFNKNQEFYTWLVEERKINPETISKEQNKKEFAQFVEDFNTATLPHEKYYNMAAYERRMTAMRTGEFVPPADDTYDPEADMRALAAGKRMKDKESERESYLSREQLMDLRRVQNERVEVGKMKLLGMDVKQSFGVRMEDVDD